MKKQQPKGMSIPQILILALALLLILAGAFLYVREERARTRDAKRMADMARVSSAFFQLYATEGSYATAAKGCPAVGVKVQSCTLTEYFSTISKMVAPGNTIYSISEVPSDTGYGVTFELERSYDNFAAGAHVLTPEGIK